MASAEADIYAIEGNYVKIGGNDGTGLGVGGTMTIGTNTAHDVALERNGANILVVNSSGVLV